jgi:hypothetical protein
MKETTHVYGCGYVEVIEIENDGSDVGVVVKKFGKVVCVHANSDFMGNYIYENYGPIDQDYLLRNLDMEI